MAGAGLAGSFPTPGLAWMLCSRELQRQMLSPWKPLPELPRQPGSRLVPREAMGIAGLGTACTV